jgi:hypothetical protein
MISRFEEIIVCATLLLISIYIEYTPEMTTTLISDFKNPNFLIGIFFIGIFSTYLLSKDYKNKEREKILESLKKSLLALVIAYLAHFDLIFTPFWLIFILAFFFHDWI